MKIAVVSDSHGNATALASVIEDAKKHQVDEFWSLGDITLTGPGSQRCYELLNAINTTHYLRGNWEDTYDQVKQTDLVDLDDPEDIAAVMQVKFDEEHFSQAVRSQIKKLPFKQEFAIDGLNFALYHNSPTSDHGHALLPTNPQENFDSFSDHTKADIIIYAHVHQQLMRYSNEGQLILNPGSVGEPWAVSTKLLQNHRANYLLLTIDQDGISDLEFRHVAYDRQKEIDLAYAKQLPFAKLYERLINTGIGFTHDDKALLIENKLHDYRQIVESFLKNINNEK